MNTICQKLINNVLCRRQRVDFLAILVVYLNPTSVATGERFIIYTCIIPTFCLHNAYINLHKSSVFYIKMPAS